METGCSLELHPQGDDGGLGDLGAFALISIFIISIIIINSSSSNNSNNTHDNDHSNNNNNIGGLGALALGGRRVLLRAQESELLSEAAHQLRQAKLARGAARDLLERTPCEPPPAAVGARRAALDLMRQSLHHRRTVDAERHGQLHFQRRSQRHGHRGKRWSPQLRLEGAALGVLRDRALGRYI